ncbi:hypothetical protein AUR64_03770 [Haloprofundus marisrubri]|uniref:Major facilitator superfamily (MFS) profile domain-containing protein n=1 Tax=Haloprofundus marisrubri TaxID=1514971 RepID=A0A0W1RD62_9EURY|nr:MFS transporter [Haloprofundus marisrubri]KTG11383.1 hypothetical protein AUR64_03770 [Haloprofundus marisrubri]
MRDSPTYGGGESLYVGWLVVVACFLGTVAIFGVSYSFGVFFERLVVEFGRSRDVVSLVFAVQTFVMCLGAGVLGPLVSVYGVKRAWVFGTGLFAIGLLGASRATSLVSLVVAYGGVAALGMGILYVASSVTITWWFDERRGLASGLASSGIGVGLLGIAPVARHLVATNGWQSAYFAIFVLVVGLLAVATQLLVDPDGRVEARADESARSRFRRQHEVLRSVVGSASFRWLFVGWTCIYLPVYAVLAHLVLYVSAQPGLSSSTGSWLLGVIGVSTGVARIGVGPIGDRTGRPKTFLVSAFVLGISVVILPATSSVASLVGFAVLFGVAYGANGALLAPVIADVYGTANISSLFGAISISFAISGLFAPYLTGLIYRLAGSYWIAFVGFGLLAILGAGCTVRGVR